MAIVDAVKKAPQFEALYWDGSNLEEVRQFVGATNYIGEFNGNHFFGGFWYGDLKVNASIYGNQAWLIRQVSGFDENNPSGLLVYTGSSFPEDFEQV